MRYEVTISYYRLDAHHVGEPLRHPVVWSRHRSLKAAGRKLAHLIMNPAKVSIRGEGVKFVVLDTETGTEFPRNACK